jgi:hypothetical protein
MSSVKVVSKKKILRKVKDGKTSRARQVIKFLNESVDYFDIEVMFGAQKRSRYKKTPRAKEAA